MLRLVIVNGVIIVNKVLGNSLLSRFESNISSTNSLPHTRDPVTAEAGFVRGKKLRELGKAENPTV